MKKLIFFVALCSLVAKSFAQTDSIGVYAIHGNTITSVEKLTHRSIKSGNGMAMAFSFGIAKIKTRLEYNGETSNEHFTHTATLRIYFGNPQIDQIQNYYMFTPDRSIKNFEVAKFEMKNKRRYLVAGTVSPYASTLGVASTKDVEVSTTRIRDGVYGLTITGKPGEYCLMYSADGRAGFGGVFDFTLE